MRAVLLALLIVVAAPALASPVDDVQARIFEEQASMVKIKSEFRKCVATKDCTTLLSFCRWRAVNKNSLASVKMLSDPVQLQCTWPKPPAISPTVSCVSGLCEIPPDGAYY